MQQNSIKFRLTVMNFLEFAVWGAYLTSMGNYLGKAGMCAEISWFYAIQGIVSIFMPTLMGIVADKFIQPQRLLGICHLIAGAAMLSLCYLGSTQAMPDKTLFIALYTLSVAFYMPTLALSNTAAFTILKNSGLDTVKHFPPIRVFGTVGFIATMWFVNCAVWEGGEFLFTFGSNAHKFQYTQMQFMVSGVLGLLLFVYCMTLPQCPVEKKPNRNLSEMLGLDAFKLFKRKEMAIFFIFSMLLGAELQGSNGYANMFIESFGSMEEYAGTFAVEHTNMLISLSQMSETLCILLIPFFLGRFGIKKVMLIAMLGWMLRFGFFAVGDPGVPGVFLFVLSMIVYGVAFDFFNISGSLFVDKEVPESMRSSAQGLFMLMTNGLGASIGVIAAQEVVNHYTANFTNFAGWPTAWYIFAGYALVIAVLFALVFKEKKA
jgi:NHS family nucleoside permease-like MFS transporter